VLVSDSMTTLASFNVLSGGDTARRGVPSTGVGDAGLAHTSVGAAESAMACLRLHAGSALVEHSNFN